MIMNKLQKIKQVLLFFVLGAYTDYSLKLWLRDFDHLNCKVDSPLFKLKKKLINMKMIFAYFISRSFTSCSFVEFKKEQDLHLFLVKPKMKNLIKKVVHQNKNLFTMGAQKVGVLKISPEDNAESYSRVGKQYGQFAEFAYVPRSNDAEVLKELEIKKKVFYVENLDDFSTWNNLAQKKEHELLKNILMEKEIKS